MRAPTSGRRHEAADVASVRLGLVLAATALFVPAAGLGVWWLLVTLWQAPVDASGAFGDSAVPSGAAAMSPPDELEVLNRRLDRRLESYGWVDREAGIVHVPIERAMARLVHEPDGRGER